MLLLVPRPILLLRRRHHYPTVEGSDELKVSMGLGPAQEESFKLQNLNFQADSTCTVKSRVKTNLSSDTSSYGLGAVLLQEHDNEWKPLCMHHNHLKKRKVVTPKLRRKHYQSHGLVKIFLGQHTLIETDHKRYVPLLSSKHLDSLPPQIPASIDAI